MSKARELAELRDSSGNVDATSYTGDGSTLTGIVSGVASVNTQTGAVVLDADDIADASTTNKFATATQLSKLDAIEALADVTDSANVTAAGALMDSEITNLNQVKTFDSSDFEPADSTILKDADIGVSVMAYDATMLVDADIGVNVMAYDATMLVDADIGVNVLAYDANVVSDATYVATANDFTTVLKNKLDGIEASANVTDATNVAAAGALMDSEISNLADVKTFNPADYATAAQGTTADSALQSVAFGDLTTTPTTVAGYGITDAYTSTEADAAINTAISGLIDSAPTALDTLNEIAASLGDDADFAGSMTTNLATKLPLAGGTMTGDISFGDNVKASFGAGSDLQIYHDGTDNYVDAAGAGNLVLQSQGDDKDVKIKSDDGVGGLTDYITVDGSTGQVKLRYYGDSRLNTTSTGVGVTGTITSDGLTVDGNGKFSGTVVDVNIIETDQTNLSTQLRQTAGQLRFRTVNNDLSAATERMRIDHPTGDISFYEDTGTDAKFFWDASAESLGIGTTTFPSLNPRIAIQGRAGASGSGTNVAADEFFIDNDGDTGMTLGSAVDGVGYYAFSDPDVALRGGLFYDHSTDDMGFRVASGTKMTINNSGDVGIGTDSPKTNLDLSSVTGPQITLTRDDGTNSAGDTLGRLNFYNKDFSGDGDNNAAIIEAVASASTGASADLLFRTKTAGTEGTDAVESMRIDRSGNVGIGTSSPGRTLDVQSASGDADVRIYAQGTTSADDAILYLGGAGTTATNRINFGDADDADRGRIIYGHSGDYMSFTTAASEAMRIDSNGNVGIGTDADGGRRLHVFDSGDAVLRVETTTASGDGRLELVGDSGGVSQIRFGDEAAVNVGLLTYTHSDNSMAFNSNGSEAMRIDSSGNLLVGTTDSNVSNNSGASNNGINLLATGQVFAAYAGNVANFNQLGTSGGSIINFDVDGSTVGSIGTDSTRLTIGSGDTGLLIAGDLDNITPYNTSTNASRDAAVDLGNSGVRFKDLYLSGGVYLGGTGSANKLDDYETGTFTPTIEGDSTAGTTGYGSQIGRYVRVGDLVHFQIKVQWTSQTGSGGIRVSGLPFTQFFNGTSGSGTPVSMYTMACANLTFTGSQIYGFAVSNTNKLGLAQFSSGVGSSTIAMDTSAIVEVTGTYYTTA
jgi:hypothetical protein